MTNPKVRARWCAGILLGILAIAAPSAAQTPARRRDPELEQRLRQLEKEVEELRKSEEGAAPEEKKVEEIDQKVKVLERQVDNQNEGWSKFIGSLPKFSVGPGGFSLTSTDQAFKLAFRAYLQADNRVFIDDDGDNAKNDFLIRRARPIMEGTLFRYVDFRLMPDFGQGNSRLFDGFIDLKYFNWASLTAGKFKPPVSLERLQSATALTFLERAYPTLLAPNRSVGTMLHGHFWENAFNYEIGVFNSLLDSTNNDGDSDDDKEVAARIFAHPFQHTSIEPLHILGIGVAGSYGDPENGSLGRFTDDGGQTFFSYASNVIANGQTWRVYPQAYWYWGPFGAMFEYVISSEKLQRTFDDRSTASQRVTDEAWQIAASWVITGEDAGWKGVTPRHALYEDPVGLQPDRPFNPFNGDWGAFQVAVRYEQINLDEDVFDRVSVGGADVFAFSNPNTSAERARGTTVGLNWFLNRFVKFQLDYEYTNFDGGAANGDDRDDEHGILTRFQFAF